MNYYDLFKIPATPIVDNTFVAKKYIELQKQYHPDFFTTQNEVDKEHALEISAEINNGYNIFKQKEKTLEYFLLQKNTISKDEKFALPPDFLMEMMELNEDFDDRMKTQNKVNQYEELLNSEANIVLNKQETLTNEDLQLLKLFYYKKKYLQRILERLAD